MAYNSKFQIPIITFSKGHRYLKIHFYFRPTISSTFKQHRKGSGGDSAGPASLRSLSGQGLTEEEAEALAAMRTEKLKDDADASKGFVISFDDDTPKKPKPQLKPRRMSNKKNSVVSEMSSDGSNSSRKENVPPEVMICIVSTCISDI